MSLCLDVLTRWSDLESVVPQWLDLMERSEGNEPTMTPEWLRAWWAAFGDEDGRELRAVVIRQGPRWLGFAPLVRRLHRVSPGIPVRRLELAPSGENEADEICSDYIGVLSERGHERDVASALCRALSTGALGGWDEVVFPAMHGERLGPFHLFEELRNHGYASVCEQTSVAPYSKLPGTWEAYLEQLPSSRRYYVKRSLRDFERWAGDRARIEHVESVADLDRGLGILISLHEQRWKPEGTEGVFRSERFLGFHRAVLPWLFESGALDLGWLSVDGEPIAAAYNMVFGGKVYFYQSGRKLDLPAKIRPGVVWHALAIRRAIDRGYREYDFLAGASRYKLELSLSARPIVRVRAFRPVWLEAAAALSDCMRRSLRGSAPRARTPLRRPAPSRAPRPERGALLDLLRFTPAGSVAAVPKETG